MMVLLYVLLIRVTLSVKLLFEPNYVMTSFSKRLLQKKTKKQQVYYVKVKLGVEQVAYARFDARTLIIMIVSPQYYP